jgi:4-aminobutyrate aminotransferase-like enzyme
VLIHFEHSFHGMSLGSLSVTGCLSKAISGYGSPMSLLLLRPELDVWAPGG